MQAYFSRPQLTKCTSQKGLFSKLEVNKNQRIANKNWGGFSASEGTHRCKSSQRVRHSMMLHAPLVTRCHRNLGAASYPMSIHVFMYGMFTYICLIFMTHYLAGFQSPRANPPKSLDGFMVPKSLPNLRILVGFFIHHLFPS